MTFPLPKSLEKVKQRSAEPVVDGRACGIKVSANQLRFPIGGPNGDVNEIISGALSGSLPFDALLTLSLCIFIYRKYYLLGSVQAMPFCNEARLFTILFGRSPPTHP
jgi:hypothetical protein